MERVRSPGPSEGTSLDSLHPLPGAPSLPALLKAVRSPGALPQEVDALQRGLASPLAAEEAPRARADFLLSLLEDSEVGGLKGSDGRSLRTAAVEALLSLGYPYALEVPPEALAEAQLDQHNALPRDIPHVGLVAALLAVLAQAVLTVPLIGKALERENYFIALFLLGTTLGPSLSTTLGAWLRSRGLQKLGLITMGLVGSFWLLAFALMFGSGARDLSATVLSLISGLSLVVGAVLLRRPEWLPKDSPAPAATPPAPSAPPRDDVT